MGMHVDAASTSSLPRPPQLHVSIEYDLVVLRLEGDYTLDAAMYVQGLLEQMERNHGYRLNLIDVRLAGTITPEARRYLLERRKKTRGASAVAVVGASFGVRTLAQMVMRALQMLTKAYLGVDFFTDEMAARSWIDIQRKRLRDEMVIDRAT